MPNNKLNLAKQILPERKAIPVKESHIVSSAHILGKKLAQYPSFQEAQKISWTLVYDIQC